MALTLSPPYDEALALALDFIRDTYDPVGVVVSGTIIRGNPQKSSDLDFVVIHDEPWRQRAQRFFAGVPAEIFVNPEFEVHRAFRREASTGRPVMSHMIATGEVVLDRTGAIARLRSQAEISLAAGPQPSHETLTQLAYSMATAFEDAVDIAAIDPERAMTQVSEALVAAAGLSFLQGQQWLPRSKELFSEFELLHPALGSSLRAAIQASSVSQAIMLAQPVIERIAGASGFFEWETDPQPLEE